MLEFQEKSEKERDRKFLELEEIVETKKFCLRGQNYEKQP